MGGWRCCWQQQLHMAGIHQAALELLSALAIWGVTFTQLVQYEGALAATTATRMPMQVV
jgi:hypothetical protein